MNSSSSYEFREEAIPFVVYNTEKRIFEINEEALDFLKQLNSPIGIISVAGMYRTGKSYLLNRMLLNRSGGFGVGPTINPCTKGIWIWGKPIQGFTPDGDPINVLVLDTEGLGALDEDSNHDVRIFSMAILISSFFIYNSVGSIDENALSSLSLVINLTKHIHLKGSGIQEDVDPEEYSQYFPSFMWVVRDFSLQLMDLEGEPITSKEYLEKALQAQKGFSDGVEQKNRIRRMLKSFFKERDCCTMIRPLTKEENLQNLEKMPLEELRPEFVEQVMQLRRKVINRIKPKMMHGKKLNGLMLYNLALSYVDAINKGAVPNIESAWSYICKNECLKAQQDAYDRFERSFSENFELRSPVFDDELKEIYIEAKRQAMEEFSKVAVGDVQKQFLVELKDKIKHKYNQIRIENEKVAEQHTQIYLQNNYVTIEKKLKNQEYDSIYDLVEELKNFNSYCLDNGPPGPNRRQIMSEFCLKALAEASEFFFKNIGNELMLQKQISQEQLLKLQNEIREHKDDHRVKLEYLETKMRAMETEKAEISAKEQSLKENFSQIMKEREQMELELTEKMTDMKREQTRLLEEAKNKIYQSEEQQKEIHRHRMAAESEYDKQKALLEQKNEFYEKQLEEAQKKEKELSTEVKNQKREHFSSVKEMQTKLEQQIKDLTKRVEEQNEQLFEWESKFNDLETKYDQDMLKLEDVNSSTKRELTKTKDQSSEVQKQLDILKRKYADEVEKFKQNQEDEGLAKSERMLELEQRCKQAEDTLEISKQKWEKDQAISKQKQEFLELQLREERTKYEEQRSNHDKMMNNIQNQQRQSVIGKEESSRRIQEIQERHSKEYQDLESKYESIRKRLTEQVDQLIERNQELELSLKIQVEDFQKEVGSLREQLSNSEEQKNRALEIAKNLDSQKLKMLEDSEFRAKTKQIELERELEEKGSEYELTIREMNDKSEEQLNSLKTFFEIEKERLERRIAEEKDRSQKRYNQMVEDYEQKLKDEQQRLEEDLQMVQEEMRDKEQQMQDIINQLDHENSLKAQQIESLDKYLQETKDSLNKIQSMQTMHLEQQLDKFNDERKELIAKIEKITGELTRKERTITTLENQKESLVTQMSQKEKVILELRKETNSEKTDLSDKIEQMRAKHQESLDELTQRKIDFERDKALKSQQLQFQEQRITELSRQLDDTIKRYDERIRFEREESQKDMQEKVQRIQSEKEIVEQKFDQKRKALKDLESNINKKTAEMERDRAVLLEKYQNLEKQQKDLLGNYEHEVTRLRESNEQLTMALQGDKAQIQEEVEKWRREYNEIERQYTDLTNTLDRERTLWDGKFKFLEQQRDTAKKDFDDAQRKFQSTVEQLQKSQQESKSKSETNHAMMLSSIETKYQQRVKEMQESNSQLVTELQQKNKTLERENKLYQEKLELNSRSKMSEQGSLEKKLEKALENEVRVAEELEQVKNDRDNKIIEYQRLLDKERESYKQKLRDTEGKGTSVQAKQTELLLNFEKERAKWEHEKSYLINQKEDAVEAQQRLEKKVENLLRENEKYKNDLRQNRKNMYQASANTSNYQAAMVGTKILGQMGSFGTKLSQATGAGAGGFEGTVFGKVGSAQTDRSNYLTKDSGVDKSFVSSSGLMGLSNHGAVGGIGGMGSGGLDSSLMNNILSTPSSEKSHGRTSTISPDEHQYKQNP